jgi:hypothetical protein
MDEGKNDEKRLLNVDSAAGAGTTGAVGVGTTGAGSSAVLLALPFLFFRVLGRHRCSFLLNRNPLSHKRMCCVLTAAGDPTDTMGVTKGAVEMAGRFFLHRFKDLFHLWPRQQRVWVVFGISWHCALSPGGDDNKSICYSI